MPPSFLVSRAARTAAGNCDPAPTEAVYVHTTRQAAETAASGDKVDSDEQAYLLLLRGDFVDYYAHGMYRTRADYPRGTVITLTVDDNGAPLDFGIGDKAPDLAQLGTVHDLLAELRSAPSGTVPAVCSG